ncbi:AAA family ATPase [Phreatobacter stygius]|uniref:CtpF protein n=1 Tax=Phreatobacter stygius TaxID=1940610 RepID=A0A4D7B5G1_9HYPH|nr:CtpF protein [Phreatobacter stygius]
MTNVQDTPHQDQDLSEQIAPVPRISLQAFCETADLAEVIAEAAEDRRMDKAHLRVQMGGAPAAAEAYRSSPTPNVVILETVGRRNEILDHLDELAEVCDATTKVIVIGQVNDIVLYRELVARGVSDYLIGPIGVLDVVRTVSSLYAAPGTKPVGRVIAVIGAKGGVGASTIAHNLGWAISRDIGVDTCIADMDLPFGTGGLDFNQDPPQGIADAVFSPDRVDTAFIDRLLSRCSDNLSLLAAPATLERVYDIGPDAFDPLIDILRATIPAIILDLPHGWTAWSKRALTNADEILVVAAPDLANLRNAKNMMDLLRASRPNDSAPRYLLNQIGVAKRPEIKPVDFAKALEADPVSVIAFEPQLFGTAANNGQMIAEMEPGHKVSGQFTELALAMTGRHDTRKTRQGLLAPLTPLLEKLTQRRKKA